MSNRNLLSRLGALFSPDPSGELRDQFYQVLCLVGFVLILFVVIPANLFQNLPHIVSVVAGVFGLLCGLLYLDARRGRHHYALFLFGLIAILNFAWFPNAGTTGSIPFYFFIPVCIVVFMLDGWRRWLACTLIVANVLVLMAVEWAYPSLAVLFHASSDRFIDLSTGVIVSMTTCVIILRLVTDGYQGERERLRVTVAALTRSEERFARMFQVNPDGVNVYDPERRIFLDVNEGFSRITGWARDEVVGRSGSDLNLWVNEDDRLRLGDLMAQQATVHDFLARLRAKDGRLFWGSTSLGVVEYGQRRVVLMTTRDVTAQIDAQREVAESRALLATMLDSTDDLVWLVDPVDFQLSAFNHAFAALMRRQMGIDLEVGMRFDSVVPGPLADQWREYYDRALRDGTFTVEYTTPGTDIVMLHSFNVVRHDGVTTGVAVFGKDISELKRAEARREQVELQLVEAQKMESLGSLAGGVAHDFNNMLGGIMGYADMLLSEETDPRRREYIEAILQASTRSAELTRKLLAFGRRGKNIVEAVDLNVIVTESLAMLRPSFRPDVVVDLQLAALWTVDGDPAQLNQLVVNLCINANEAMPAGGTLTVRTRSIEDAAAGAGGERVELTVSDTGVGMSDEVKARIFEPFFTTKLRGRAPGTGLGLSTVYGVVHLQKGTIDVRSAPGQGTTFTVRMPRGTLAGHAEEAHVAQAQGRGLILIVEDEAILRRFAEAALQKLGYSAVTAADGEEGIQVFRARHAELHGVLLDLKMPKKDGREAFLAFRDIDASVPVLICSGYGDNEEAQGLISLGARGLLPKPYRVTALADMLARLGPPARH